MPELQSVLITGASSGLGAALATELAAPGVTLHLSGRDPDRLHDTTAVCEARGAVAHPKVLDIRNEAAMDAWVTGAGRLDLVIANAGISAGTGRHEPESPGQTRTIFATNLTGVLNTVLPAMQVMQIQPPGADGLRGRIAVIASIAAFVPAPGAPVYCASKSAVDAWVVGTRPVARMRGITLTSVCPGYIRTAMTARNQFPMPGLMDADRAARIILRGIRRGRARIVFPWWMGLGARIGGLLPADLLGRLLATQAGKASDPAL
jgi:short-subunit dehydrogenase